MSAVVLHTTAIIIIMTVQQVSGYLLRGLLLDHLKMCEMITHLMIF